MNKGSCLCKAVRFEVTCPLPAPDCCHCIQCRKYASNGFTSSDIPRSALKLEGEEMVRWYQSSEKARRGFCSQCGSFLFWAPIKSEWIGVAMGAFDAPTRTKMRVHIFTDNKGDYYDIKDDVPQKGQH